MGLIKSKDQLRLQCGLIKFVSETLYMKDNLWNAESY